LTVKLREAVERGDVVLPPMPKIGDKILGMLGDDSGASSKEIANTMGYEPAIAVTVLKVANSAAFGGLCEVTELQQAVARLGLKQVASVVTALVLKGNFTNDRPDKSHTLAALWDHAVATAVAARHVTGVFGGDAQEAFLAGLLHDVGKLLVLNGVDYLQAADPDVEITNSVLSQMMLELHAELGHHMLKEWKLPEPICRVALRHHVETPEPDEGLLVRVQAANAIARDIAAHPDPAPEGKLSDLPAFEILNVSDVELAALLVDLEDELEELKSLL